MNLLPKRSPLCIGGYKCWFLLAYYNRCGSKVSIWQIIISFAVVFLKSQILFVSVPLLEYLQQNVWRCFWCQYCSTPEKWQKQSALKLCPHLICKLPSHHKKTDCVTDISFVANNCLGKCANNFGGENVAWTMWFGEGCYLASQHKFENPSADGFAQAFIVAE